jgi:hypothetical protein
MLSLACRHARRRTDSSGLPNDPDRALLFVAAVFVTPTDEKNSDLQFQY